MCHLVTTSSGIRWYRWFNDYPQWTGHSYSKASKWNRQYAGRLPRIVNQEKWKNSLEWKGIYLWLNICSLPYASASTMFLSFCLKAPQWCLSHCEKIIFLSFPFSNLLPDNMQFILKVSTGVGNKSSTSWSSQTCFQRAQNPANLHQLRKS